MVSAFYWSVDFSKENGPTLRKERLENTDLDPFQTRVHFRTKILMWRFSPVRVIMIIMKYVTKHIIKIKLHFQHFV